MTKLDLKDAYLSITVHPASQRFLRFIWKSKSYQFQALRIGLNIAPLVFTRLLKPVAAFLRKRGIRLIIYLDDILLIGSSIKETSLFTEMTMSLLESLGFIINKEKSVLHPTQTFIFLGFIICSVNMTLTLPPDKVTKLRSQRHQLLTKEKVTLHSVARILGTLDFFRLATSAGSTSHSQTSKSAETGATQISGQLQRRSDSILSGESGITMVDSQHRTLQRQPYSGSSSRSNDFHRRIETGMEGSLRQLENERKIPSSRRKGLPADVAELLIAATRSSTRKTYEFSWKRWRSWCCPRQIDPVSASLKDILTFLFDCYDSSLQYGSSNVLRSTISATHPKIDGYSMGQHPYVINILKGILNLRLP